MNSITKAQNHHLYSLNPAVPSSCVHFYAKPLQLSLLSLILVPNHVSCPLQLSEILKFGVDKLLSSEESSVQDVKLEKILGPSRQGQWVDEDFTSLREKEEEEEENGSESDGQSMFHL